MCLQAVMLISILMNGSLAVAQFGTVILADNFDRQLAQWTPISLEGAKGFVNQTNGALQVRLDSGLVYGAYYNPTSYSGHFSVEVDFDEHKGVALALMKEVNGQPSMENYVMIKIEADSLGTITVKLTNRQNGRQDVFDQTNKISQSRYTHTLDGQTYSVPYRKTGRKLRMLRHAQEKVLHCYYAVEKEVDGKIYQDWMALAPLKVWGAENDRFYVGLFSVDGHTHFNNIAVHQLPLHDPTDLNTGFKITQRPYTWSGYTDSAMVVTFGKHTPMGKADHKWVFWRLANHVPAWHINHHTLFTYGFVETWDGGNIGCHEPMSDRLLAYSDLEIVEDNAVRKVIKWSYTLVDPNYKIPTHGQGSQRPEATEYYLIYADGSIIRKVRYAPKLDSSFRNWHEIMEMMVIAGGNRRPGSLLAYPSLSFHRHGQKPMQFDNTGEKKYRNHNQRLGATTLSAYVKDAPVLFAVLSDDLATPATYSGYPLNYEVSWHNRSFNFGHWPINKEPYQHPHKSSAVWPEQVAHTSLVGVGLDLGQGWQDHYYVRTDGRKYRQWLSLLGMANRNGQTSPESYAQAWLFPAHIKTGKNSAAYIGYSHADKYYEFETVQDKPYGHFAFTPKSKLFNPVLRIKRWGQNPVFIRINGKALAPARYITSVDEAGDLMLLVLGTYDSAFDIKVSDKAAQRRVRRKPTEKANPG